MKGEARSTEVRPGEGGGQLKKKSVMKAAAAKSLQSCPTLCDPTDSSSAGSPVHRVLQVRILEWVAISLSSDESRAVLNYYRSNDS